MEDDCNSRLLRRRRGSLAGKGLSGTESQGTLEFRSVKGNSPTSSYKLTGARKGVGGSGGAARAAGLAAGVAGDGMVFGSALAEIGTGERPCRSICEGGGAAVGGDIVD